MKFVGKIRGLGSHYVETGLERVEIWINKSDAEGMPYELGERVAIELIIGSKMFTAGLRATEGTPYVWVSPDLVDDDGYEVSLVHVGINKHTVRQQVPYLYMSI
jgi:hypothetical protein